MLEERLKEAFALIWHELLANPQADVKTVLRDVLLPVQRRIQIGLDSRSH